MLGGLICVAPIFTPIFFGPGFGTVSPILQVLCILIPLISITEMIGVAYLIPSGREKIFTRIILVCSLLNVVLNVGFIYMFGAFGAAIGTAISELAKAIIAIFVVRKELKFKEILKKLTKKIISTGVMIGFVLPMSILSTGSTLSLIAIILSGVIVFFVTEYLLQDEEFLIMARFCLNPFVKLIKKKKHE